MYKIFVRTVIVVTILALATASWLWERRADYVSDWLTETLQVPAAVKDFSYADRVMTFANVHIGTPEGSASDTALAATEVRMTCSWQSLMSNNVVIDELAIDNPLLGFELYSADGKENNWASIINRLNLISSEEDAEKTYMVRKVVLNNVRIYVTNQEASGTPPSPEPIERIELYGVGSKAPVPYRIVLATILREVLHRTATDPALQEMITNIKPFPYDMQVNGEVIPAYGIQRSHAVLEERLNDLEKGLRALLDEPTDLR